MFIKSVYDMRTKIGTCAAYAYYIPIRCSEAGQTFQFVSYVQILFVKIKYENKKSDEIEIVIWQ